MRVGFVSTYPPIECGVATYTQYLGEALREKQTDVYVVSHMGGSGYQVFPAFDYEDGDIAEKAFEMMVRFTPEVVHIQHEFGLYGKHAGVAVTALIMEFRMAGIPVVTTLHTVYPQIPPAQQVIIESIFLNSSKVIIHESYQQETLEKILPPAAAEKIERIPHGARLIERVADAKERLGLPLDKKIILMIGYFRPSKNFELGIDIFPEILADFPDAVLVVAGKTRGTEHREYRNRLFEKIARSPNREQIYLIRGQLPQKTFDTIISAADVVVLPYKIASQSGILAHCLAFSRPIVTSNTAAMKQSMEKTGAGLVCKDRQEFVENIVRILSDETLAHELSQNGKKYVHEVISWPRVAERHLKVYRSLIDIPKLESHVILVD